MHAHLKIKLKWALHFSTLAITCYKNLSQATINTTLQASLLLKDLTSHMTPTFKTKALRLVSDVQRAKCLFLLF